MKYQINKLYYCSINILKLELSRVSKCFITIFISLINSEGCEGLFINLTVATFKEGNFFFNFFPSSMSFSLSPIHIILFDCFI